MEVKLYVGNHGIPLTIESATTSTKKINFHNYSDCCRSRVNLANKCSKCGHEARVGFKGYEIDDDDAVLFTPEEAKALKDDTGRIDIMGLADKEQITSLRLNSDFSVQYAIPRFGKKVADKLDNEKVAKAVAMIQTGIGDKVVIGKYWKGGTDYLVSLENYEQGFIITPLNYDEDIKEIKILNIDVELSEEDVRKANIWASKQELIDDLSELHNESYGKFKEIIRQKRDGEIQTVERVINVDEIFN